jgi:hypothetical protein
MSGAIFFHVFSPLGIEAAQNLAAETGAAQCLGQVERVEEQQAERGATERAAQHPTVRVARQHRQRQAVGIANDRVVERVQAAADRLLPGRVDGVGNQDVRHGDSTITPDWR